MVKIKKTALEEKVNLHLRNKHRTPYNFPALIEVCPQLSQYVALNKFKNLSVDYKNPEAVKTLNKALLMAFYNVQHWDIPQGYLCPPIPGRMDYIHYVADLLAFANKREVPRGAAVNVLDIGAGANCIYPLLGHSEYGWSFVGTDIDDVAINSAKSIVADNALTESIEIRKQESANQILTGVIKPTDIFDLIICNPPFHSSLGEARAGTERKWKNLGIKKSGKQLNFGGHNTELWYEGGEERFVCKMIVESEAFAKQGLWFTSLISKKETLRGCYHALEEVKAKDIITIDMAQGQKTSRILAWTFMDMPERKAWSAKRF
jgi:23S rRNA (adenine1618-N6)-methyltransferase